MLGADTDRQKLHGVLFPSATLTRMIDNLCPPSRQTAKPARPDRVGTVAMTARVSPKLRKIYSVIAAELGVPKNELHTAALRSLLTRFLVRSEWPAEWEKLLAEFGEQAGN